MTVPSLYEILFSNEAAPTPADALKNNVVAIQHPEDFGSISLIKKQALLSVLKDLLNGNLDIDEGLATLFAEHNVYAANLVFLEMDEAIKISTSAAVEKYGPLGYQLVMSTAPQKYLISDHDLSPTAQKVWGKFYELSETGVYDRIWLEQLKERFYEERTYIYPTGVNPTLWDEMLNESAEKEYGEKEFLDMLSRNGVLPTQCGWFWGYRQKQKMPMTEDLFEQGNIFIRQVAAELGPALAKRFPKHFKSPEKTIRTKIAGGSTIFFTSRYG